MNIILIIVLVFALVFAFWCFLDKGNNTRQRLLHEEMLSKEEALKEKDQEQLTRLQDDVDGLQKSIDNLMNRSASLESELLSAKRQLESAERDIRQCRGRMLTARQETDRINTNIADLKNRIAVLVKQTLDADQKLMILMKTKEALADQLESYKSAARQQPVSQQYEEQNIRERDLDTVTETVIDNPALPSGEVLTVNREFAFLVTNLGKSSGIEEGLVLDIRRDNKSLGRCRVETVRENISAAALVDKDNLSQIRAGDKVFVEQEI
ncbi:MAG: hypothetical protein PHV77_01610 [Candidatus Omnitrophica bacterium]|nr:hypothetical protein [Candidatus Omnitrophota bacterium]